MKTRLDFIYIILSSYNKKLQMHVLRNAWAGENISGHEREADKYAGK